MKAIRLTAAALFLSLLASCSLLNSLLSIPTSLLKVVGRTAGIGLTDEAPDPVKPITVGESEFSEPSSEFTESKKDEAAE